jgi:superfamily II DNA helicase RecQ
LAGVLNAWRSVAPDKRRHRTIFLSATFSDAALETLKDLFSPEAGITIASGARVRPEPEYWVAPVSNAATRVRRVHEALCHLPRPAILYVTRVADAEWWSAHLRSCGFSRVALVHGGTSAQARETIR